MSVKYLSICSGIEAASAAWETLGWTPLAFAEIEAFPSAVLKHRYPTVPNLGDMTRFREWPEEIFVDCDVLVGGPPCQAFSVAGLRKGIADPRGALTLCYVQLLNHIDEVRFAHGKPPTTALYENVPGLLSDKDNAFGNFLGALCGEDDALLPAGPKWTNAGSVLGPRRALAWRVLDAQHFGVAQRRRRVFLVAGARAGQLDPVQVLLVEQGVCWDPPSRGEAQPRPAAPVASGADSGGLDGPDLDGGRDGGGGGGVAYGFQPRIARNGRGDTGDLVNARNAQSGQTGKGDAAPCVAQAAYPDPAYALSGGEQTFGTGRSNQDTFVCSSPAAVAFTTRGRADGLSVEYQEELAYALKNPGAGGRSNDRMIAHVVPPQGFDSYTNEGSNNFRLHNCVGEPRTIGSHWDHPTNPHPAITQAHNAGGIGASNQEIFSQRGSGLVGATLTQSDVAGPLDAHYYKGPGSRLGGEPRPPAMAVRRLTPVECERLQGFPDHYTDIPWKGKPAGQCPDGPRYKALGNSMAVPVIRWIGLAIARTLETTP